MLLKISFPDRALADIPLKDMPEFVAPLCARYGVGSALLARSVNALREIGYRELASTFLLGNESSTLWHWRNGFRLLSYLGSPGNIQRSVRRKLS